MSNDNTILLHYTSLSEFKHQYLNSVIDERHIVGDGRIHFGKLASPDGDVDEYANFWGWQFKKDGETYLLPDSDKEGNKRVLKEQLPLIPIICEDVANSGKVYKKINKHNVVQFRSEKRMTMRELIDMLSNIPHSNKEHQKLLVMMGISSYIDRVNFRISSPPGFGKDSTVEILANLVGKCATIENPTVAKLEYEAGIRKWLAVNEIVDIKKDKWVDAEQFLLSVGAFKPHVNKSSRSTRGVGEVINIKNLSLTLMYNDIDCYKFRRLTKSRKYFDDYTKEAVKDRFVPVRLYGHYTADFTKIDSINVSQFVKDNWDKYIDMVYTITYYSNNLLSELKGYDRSKLIRTPQRWNTSLQKILRVVDAYSNDQEEFDHWVKVLNNAIIDYKAMLVYNVYLEQLTNKYGEERTGKVLKELKAYNTFSEKVSVMDRILTSNNNNYQLNNW